MAPVKQRPAPTGLIRRSAWWTLAAGLLLACGSGQADTAAGAVFEPGWRYGERVLTANKSNNNNNQNQKAKDARQEAAEQAWAQQQQAQQQQQQQGQPAAAQAEQQAEPLKPMRAPPPVPGVRVLAARAGAPSPAQIAQQAMQAKQAQQVAQAQRDRQVQKLPPPPAAMQAQTPPPPPPPLTPSPGNQQQAAAQQAAAQQAAAQQAAAQQAAAQQAAAQQAAAQQAAAQQAAAQQAAAQQAAAQQAAAQQAAAQQAAAQQAAAQQAAAQQAAAQQAAAQQAAAQQAAAQQAAAQQAAAQNARAFNNALVTPVAIDRSKPPSFNYKGQLHFDKRGNASLDANGRLEGANGAANSVGRFLGGGANSKVYASTSSNNRVKKMVYLGKSSDPNKIARTAQTLTDQDGGRAILNNLKAKMPDSPFRVAQRDGQLMTVKATDAKGEEHWFALSREENIASQVVVQDKTRPDFGKTITVTDAAGRVQARAKDQYGQKTLTAAEELTVNLVMRDLNQNGVVWTDHKLANFDIVADPSSATGHRVVFFDLDGFRPVRGATPEQRYESAREMQRIFDTAPDMGVLQSRLASFQQQKYPDGYGAFDFTAFGGGNLGWLATPGANKTRQAYNMLNNMGRENFAKTITTFNAANNKNAKYVAPPRP